MNIKYRNVEIFYNDEGVIESEDVTEIEIEDVPSLIDAFASLDVFVHDSDREGW